MVPRAILHRTGVGIATLFVVSVLMFMGTSVLPGDVAQMHSHPDSVLIFLADGAVRFTFPDGETEDFHFRAGEAVLMPATSHAAENLGDSSFQLFQIEVKD